MTVKIVFDAREIIHRYHFLEDRKAPFSLSQFRKISDLSHEPVKAGFGAT